MVTDPDPACPWSRGSGRSDRDRLCAAWDDGEAQRHIAWTRACWRAMEPFASSGVYINFLGNEGEGRVKASYGVNFERLVALKNRYDPTNFFTLNQNIKPTIKEGEPCLRQVEVQCKDSIKIGPLKTTRYQFEASMCVTIGRALRPFPRSKPSVPLSRHSAFRTRPSDPFSTL